MTKSDREKLSKLPVVTELLMAELGQSNFSLWTVHLELVNSTFQPHSPTPISPQPSTVLYPQHKEEDRHTVVQEPDQEESLRAKAWLQDAHLAQQIISLIIEWGTLCLKKHLYMHLWPLSWHLSLSFSSHPSHSTDLHKLMTTCH